MAEITAAAVKALRELTDMPMMKCKEALKAADGDQAGAIAILKQEAGRVMTIREGNVTSEGRIFLKVRDGGTEAAMVEIQCESEPVGRGDALAKFGQKLVDCLLDGPGAESPDQLLDQEIPGEGKTFRSVYDDMVGTIREKIVVNRVARVPGPIAGYVHHDYKTGVLFQATGGKGDHDVLRDVAMHIAALRPAFVNVQDVAPEAVAEERERLTAEAKASGKPDNIVEKIVDGRMNSFYVEQGVLLMQAFAKDDSKSVSQALAEKGFEAAAFTRWTIGN